jgi:hypothetical protein
MKATGLLPIVLFALILFSGCVTLPVAEQCEEMEGMSDDQLVSDAGWGELITTDETYALKSKIGCWHSVALADAARSDPQGAAEHCTKILDLKGDYPDDEDTLKSEFNLCVDAVAKRLRNTELCENIDAEEFSFQHERCIAHATPPPPMCSSALILSGLFALLFFARRE